MVKQNKTKRLSWDDYFMKIAFLVAERSTCRRHNIGAVVVKNKRVMTTGYNGAVSGVEDCLKLGCYKDQNNLASGTGHNECRAVHAEQNAIIQAAQHGINIRDGTLYCTHSPCRLCARMAINAGIKRFVACIEYSDKTFKELFVEAGVEYATVKMPQLKINILE